MPRVLDEWLRKLSSKNLKVTVATIMERTGVDDGQAPEVRRARIMASQAQTKLERYMDAIEKGMDPALTSSGPEQLSGSYPPPLRSSKDTPMPTSHLSLRTSSTIFGALSATLSRFSGTLTQTNGADCYQELGFASPTSA